MNQYNFSNKTGKWPKIFLLSIGVITALFILMYKISMKPSHKSNNELVIYCAAGIRLPITEIAENYSKEYNIPVRFEYSSSGELEAKLSQDATFNKNRADLYIPADYSFRDRTKNKGLTVESLPLAEFRLVLAVKPDSTLQIRSVKELLDRGFPFAVCNEKAGAGKKTINGLKKSKLWEIAKKKIKVQYPTVTECANAIKTSNDIKAGFIWDTTARQFGLKIIDTPELSSLVSTITVNVVSSTTSPPAALHFARYLSSPEKGTPVFTKYSFTPAPGDNWADSPKLILYCGGVNRNAVEKTIKEFELREGVTVEKSYAGCGTLVSSIFGQSLNEGFPDAFMTCDKSYMDKVNKDFLNPSDISATDIIILTRKGNPKNIKTIKDLAAPGLKVGTTDQRKSTLGYLSWQIFQKMDIEEQMKSNVIVTSPTAHELLSQYMAHDKLDAVLVYKANCSQVLDEYHIIIIDHPLATAIQNIGISKKSHYPLIMTRLVNALKSAKSKARFEQVGFKWMAK